MHDFLESLYAQGYPQATVIGMAVISLPQRKNSGHLTGRVAEEVRALMGRHNMTQVQLAAVLGVSQPQVGKRVKGVIPFTLDEIEVLAGYFDVSPAELLGERVSPRPGPDGGAQSRSTLVRSYRTSPRAA